MLFMHNTAGRRTLYAMGVGILCFLPVLSFAKPKPPKMTVQLYAERIVTNGIPTIIDVFLVLPDGSKAIGHCLQMIGGSPCHVDSFVPEKRVVQDCVDAKQTIQASCFTNETYYADRSGNEITVYGENGKVTYHITGSWDSFELGKLPPSNFDPNWTAYCRDGTYSYSRNDAGTCSEHGGVYSWRNP